jgi:hypothetical protein
MLKSFVLIILSLTALSPKVDEQQASAEQQA